MCGIEVNQSTFMCLNVMNLHREIVGLDKS